MPKAFAIIPARAGSTRAINKNFRVFDNTSLAELAISVAKLSGVFELVVLSTDYENGPSIAARLGVQFHKRSEWAANSEATASDVLADMAPFLVKSGIQDEDYIFYLQPTSPLRTTQLLVDIWNLLRSSKGDGAVSVFEVDRKYLKIMSLEGDRLRPVFHGDLLTRNYQDLETVYLANGNFFAFRWGRFVAENKFPVSNLLAVTQTKDLSVDIDTEQDFADFLAYFRARATM